MGTLHILVLLLAFSQVLGETAEERLFEHLTTHTNRFVRPAKSHNETITMRFGLALIEIQDVNEQGSYLKAQYWLRMLWQDYRLKWDPSHYDGITVIRMPNDKVWKPDMVLYNTGSEAQMLQDNIMTVIYNSGDVLWMPPAILTSTCYFDVSHYPFDEQTCSLKFGSWTYDGYMLDLEFYEDQKQMDLSDFNLDNEWEVTGNTARKYTRYYPCCVEPYPDIIFNLTLKRRSSSFAMVHVTPVVLIAIVVPWLFAMPYREPQRFALGGSLLITSAVLLSSFEGVFKSASGSVPIVAKYYVGISVLVSLSLLFSAIITWLANKAHCTGDVPKLLKLIFIDVLGRLMCVSKEEKSELAGPEWHLMAQALDRLLFILYVIITIIMSLAFFV